MNYAKRLKEKPTRIMGQPGKSLSPAKSRLTHTAPPVTSHTTKQSSTPKVLHLPVSTYRKTDSTQMTVAVCVGPVKAAEQLLLPRPFVSFGAMPKEKENQMTVTMCAGLDRHAERLGCP